MENMTKFYGFFCLGKKKKYQLQFFKKLFTYGSGTSMRDFNEQQRRVEKTNSG